MAPTAPTVTLTRQVVSDFQIAKIFNENGKRPINAIDFDATGELCVTTADDDTIRLYDCQTGTEKKTLYSKKYGCSLGRFTHHSSHILHAAAKDHIIRYLSLHDNQYLRYFKGHAGRVVNLEMSSQDDTFISSAMDSTVRLWDLRTNHCQGLIHTAPGARTSVGFDHTGLVFATGDSRVVRMFDARNYESGPFATFPVADAVRMLPYANAPAPLPFNVQWTNLRFSNDGKHVLLSTDTDLLIVIDGFDGSVRQLLRGHLNVDRLPLEGCFSPDGQFVWCGSQNGLLHAWEVATGQMVTANPSHSDPSKVVACNPKFLMMASADMQLAFWTQALPGV